jgi:hypothetical protein
VLSEKFLEFLEMARSGEVGARIVPSLTDARYVFLARSHGEDRQDRIAELYGRCLVARGLDLNTRTVIGIATELPEPGKGYSLDALYLDKPEWTDEDQRNLEYLQREFGYFASSRQTRLRTNEYPGT